MKKQSADKETERAFNIIESGGVIMYPTDTIWGIGCDATCEPAVQRILDIKQRPAGKGLIILVDSPKMLKQYVRHIPRPVYTFLSQKDIPTTIIFPDVHGLAGSLYAPDGSAGIRLTSDPFCRKLINRMGRPLVSTSANFSGEPPPAGFRFINNELIARMDYVVPLRQNETYTGKPSRIIRVLPDNTVQYVRK